MQQLLGSIRWKPWAEKPRSLPTQEASPSEFTLCLRCQAIDFAKLHREQRRFDSSAQVEDVIPFRALEQHEGMDFRLVYDTRRICKFSPELISAGCSLCALLLHSLANIRSREYATLQWELFTEEQEHSLLSPGVFLKLRQKGQRLSAADEGDALPLIHYLSTKIGNMSRLMSIELDYKWLARKLKLSDRFQNLHQKTSNVMTGMKLLDCWFMNVVDVQETNVKARGYVALSYVWGHGPSHDRPSHAASPATTASLDYDEMPQAIRNAVRLVLRIRLRYIWIDRYCIAQHNNPIKQQQIAMMSSIFSGAIFTLVSLHPDDQPLPGVSTPRKQPAHVRTQDGIVLVGCDVRAEVEHSPWASRCWTLSEALLSNRLLFFLPHMMVLSTPHASYVEPVLKFTPTANRSFLKLMAGVWAEPLNIVRPFDWHSQGSLKLGQAFYIYAQRKLTFETDAIDAFRGFFDKIRTKTHWGVPILSREITGAIASHHEPGPLYHELGFCVGLLWFPLYEYYADRSDSKPRPPTLATVLDIEENCVCYRFPSWTWAKGRQSASLSYDHFLQDEKGKFAGPLLQCCRIALKDPSGMIRPASQTLSAKKYIDLASEQSDKCLYITGRLLLLPVQPDYSTTHSDQSRTPLGSGWAKMDAPGCPHQHTPHPEHSYHVLPILAEMRRYPGGLHNGLDLGCLVLLRVDTPDQNRWRRVGVIRLFEPVKSESSSLEHEWAVLQNKLAELPEVSIELVRVPPVVFQQRRSTRFQLQLRSAQEPRC